MVLCFCIDNFNIQVLRFRLEIDFIITVVVLVYVGIICFFCYPMNVMQILNIVQTLIYNLDHYKMSTDDKITTMKNINTVSTVDTILTLC